MVEGSMNKLSMANGKLSMVAEKTSPSDVITKQEKSKVVVLGLENNPIIIIEGASTDHVIIKPVTQLSVINSKAIPWNYEWVIVTYKGKEVKEEVNEAQGLTRSGRCFAPEELRKAKTSKDNPILVKKVVTEKEAEEFLRKMKVQDYSIVEQLRKFEPSREDCQKIFEVNRVTFSDDELPVKYEDSVVTKVLVDNGSSANIFPLSTLNKLKVDDERIHKNNICVRGFNGGGKDSVGDIVLELTIGPVEFTMEFQVYQVFETVPVEKVPEGKRIPTPKITSELVTVAFEILKNGVVLGKGLGASLQGIIQPVSLPDNLGKFGLRFKPTMTDVKRAKRFKQKAWSHPKPIPHLSRSFVKPGAWKCLVTIVPSFVIDIDEELIERFLRLFDDVNMVEVGEGSSKADVQFVRPNVKLNNWKATPLPTWMETWKLLGFIVSRRGIKLDLSKIKAIQELPPPKNKTEVMSLLGRLNYISRFIARLTTTFETIFKLLKRDVVVKWIDEFQEAFDKIKEYLSNPHVLVPPEPERPLILYFTVLDNSFGCVLGQRDITSRKEQAIYYLSKKFTSYEVKSIDFRHITRIHNEVVDALATLASMLHHLDKAYVDPLHIQVRDQHAYCNLIEEELDGDPWFHDIREYIRMGVYPVQAAGDQKRAIRFLTSGFFYSGGVLYKRTLDLQLLRCIDARQASTIMTEVHSVVCGSYMSEYVLGKKILRAGYYFLTMERDCISFSASVISAKYTEI
ncbi:uncharacterized protein [Nicotiana sylvestris]|uniref:uncharacterized protein n=1 Tax=Nicotiana sylvestris TaxID=4096 RepID=UPI00388CBFBB